MNQRRALIWVSLGAPLLVLLALLATNQRQGKDRVQVLPAVSVSYTHLTLPTNREV